ncbi:hypothetical protein ACIO6T_26240 [Streptomyces sp. NPDC087532]|uniref:hypothetical protein n=1 Tax=Streptomyces sp. NPDC087532 TaxID=3365795 RepID=UPI0037F79348
MIEKVRRMTAVRKPYLLGHAEIAALYGVERQTSQKWRADGTLPDPDLLVSGNPYWLLTTVLKLNGVGGREATARRLAAFEAGTTGGYRAKPKASLPVILGITELAQVLGRDKQAISRWRHRKQLADADYVLSGSPLWLLDTVLADARARDRALQHEEVERLRARERGAQKPRGRTSKPPEARTQPSPLPVPRTFTRDQGDEAEAFLAAAFAQGLSVVIRPKRQKP